MRTSFTVLSAAALLTLAGCSAAAPSTTTAASTSSNDVVRELGFAGENAKQIVQAIDSSPDARPLAYMASVKEGQLLLTKDGRQASLPLPADSFYLSIAPYLTQTHDCYYHSLATCKGELSQQAVTVTITEDSGKVLVNEQTKTYSNGFVGFWLPRDIKGTVTVKHENHTGTADFATMPDSATCLTTLKLT